MWVRKTLKEIFDSCQQLESFRAFYLQGGKKLLEFIAKYSPKNFHELTLVDNHVKLSSNDLESFFINWQTREPQKSLSFIVNSFVDNNKTKEIIRKYKNMGVIKKFVSEQAISL